MSTATQTKQASAIDTIDAMLRSIDDTNPIKRAAEANTEAGGYQGETEHQVKNEDDHTEDAREGSRSSENERDVKEDQGAPGVDGKDVNAAHKAALGLPAKQDDVQMDIGVTSKATGEDPSNETDRTKPGKDDSSDGTGGSQGRGQTSHPARTSNNEIDGHKWSSDISNVLDLIKTAEAAGNDALAAISVEADDTIKKQAGNVAPLGDGQKQAGSCEKCGNGPCTCSGGKCASDGQAAGAAAVGGEVPGTDKQAQDAQVVNDLHNTILAGYMAADKTAAYIAGVVEGQRQKAAMEEEGHDEASEGGGEETPGTNPPSAEDGNGGEAPPEAIGGDPLGGMGGMGEGMPGGGGEEEALLAALTGGGEMGGMGGGPEMGGPPMDGGMPGLGGPPPEMGGGMPGGGGEIGPEELQMLAAALQEAGVGPEALEAGAAAKAAHALKAAAAKGQPIRTEWRPKTAGEAQRYQAVLNYVKEVARVA